MVDIMATKAELRRRKREKDITVQMLASACNVSGRAVKRWMSDKYKDIPGLDNMLILSELFGCTVNDLCVKTQSDAVK